MAKFHPKPFGKYFLIDKLATGGMAEIYKAKTFGVDGFEKLLAIKRILPHCAADGEFIKMLIDEAKLSVLLSHTNIVQVYDLGKVGEDYFISMEFINGINMRELLNRLKDSDTEFPEELVVYIISEVCKGLDYAHSKKDAEGQELNIVHRDISPQNILLSFEGEVKIVDFGIAKAAMNISHTMAGILKGKISYMSPEQALGKPIDRKTDIFSTGLMLYELITGDKLFKGETQFEVLKKIRTTRLNENSFPETVSEPIRKILAKALAYSTKDRYETAGDFQIDLTRYLYTTYADFTPRKLANLMRKLFATEIKTKKAKEQKEAPVESQTQSIMVSAKSQEDIVHRDRTSEQTMTGSTKQPTQTFIESFISGKEEAPVEPSITRTGHQQAAAQAPEPEVADLTPTPTGELKYDEAEAPEPEVEIRPPRKRGFPGKIIYPLLGVLLIAAAGAYAYFKTDWFKPAPPPPPKITGIVQIHSIPDGAQIFLNDSETNLVTPATLEKLEIGKPQKITLKKPKHKEWSKTITLLDQNPVNLQPTLEVIPVGTIKVASTPPGAKIFLDGKDTEKVTPTTLEDLPLSQTYTVKLEMEKFKPFEQRITLYSIDPIEFNKKLEEIQYGSIRVTSNPSGAAVYLNNGSTGKTTPTTLGNLEVGKRYNIRIAKTGYQDSHRSVDLASKGTTTVSSRLTKVEEKPKEETQTAQDKMREAAEKLKQLELEKQQKEKQLAEQKKEAEKKEAERKEAEKKEAKKEEPKKEEPKKEEPQSTVAYVSVSSSPKGADVFINGVRMGSAPGKFKVTPGKPAEITVSKSGLSTVTRVVTVRPGETRSLGTLNLQSSKDAVGVIVIDSNPPGAMVLMNGQAQRRTPLRIKGLRPGQNYTFTVKKDGYKSWTREVTVGEGSKSFMANLKKN